MDLGAVPARGREQGLPRGDAVPASAGARHEEEARRQQPLLKAQQEQLNARHRTRIGATATATATGNGIQRGNVIFFLMAC